MDVIPFGLFIRTASELSFLLILLDAIIHGSDALIFYFRVLITIVIIVLLLYLYKCKPNAPLLTRSLSMLLYCWHWYKLYRVIGGRTKFYRVCVHEQRKKQNKAPI